MLAIEDITERKKAQAEPYGVPTMTASRACRIAPSWSIRSIVAAAPRRYGTSVAVLFIDLTGSRGQ